MSELTKKVCEPCKTGAPPATQEEIDKFKPQIPQWELIEVDGIKRLLRKFTFDDFVKALNFTNKVGELAEQEGHHPAILTEWGSVEVSWWTHKIGGLHMNDFIMAARTDELFDQ
jgi:4a-hydroxytetrahydrobiopterin dehydratase